MNTSSLGTCRSLPNNNSNREREYLNYITHHTFIRNILIYFYIQFSCVPLRNGIFHGWKDNEPEAVHSRSSHGSFPN